MTGSYPRFLLAAPKSGSGKTMITCGLLTALKKRGIACCSFKCGPDYIDPMFHKEVLGIDGGNLDTYFLSRDRVRTHFLNLAGEERLSVIEGVMGYYDGVGGDTTEGSTYEVASVIDAPVVLVLDSKGASLSLAAEVKGFLEYREDSHIAGVILNRMSEAVAKRLRPKLEELGIRVFGFLPESENARLDSRHLGLKLPGELNRLNEKLEALAEELEATVDIDGLLELSRCARPLFHEARADRKEIPSENEKFLLGVARDEAFCFYYQENLKLLEELGAKLVPFSPIHDKSLPKGICGLLLGGGYPELYGKELSENKTMRHEIHTVVSASMPVLAECGGFMYLHEELETREHDIFSMTGIIKGRVFPTNRLTRFGYIEAFAKEDSGFLKKGESIRGHEFHYWDSTSHGAALIAKKPGRNKNWECVHMGVTMMAGFPHFYYPSNPLPMKRFAKACRRWKKDHEIQQPGKKL